MATSPRRELDQSGPGRRRHGPGHRRHGPRPPAPRAPAIRATGPAGDRLLGWFAPPGGKPRAILWHGARTV